MASMLQKRRSARLAGLLLSLGLVALGAQPAALAQGKKAPKSYVLGEMVLGDTIYTCVDKKFSAKLIAEFNTLKREKVKDKLQLIQNYRAQGYCDYYADINHVPIQTLHFAPTYYKSEDGKLSRANLLSVIQSEIYDEKQEKADLVKNLIVLAQVPAMQAGQESIVTGKATDSRCNHRIIDLALADVCRP